MKKFDRVLALKSYVHGPSGLVLREGWVYRLPIRLARELLELGVLAWEHRGPPTHLEIMQQIYTAAEHTAQAIRREQAQKKGR